MINVEVIISRLDDLHDVFTSGDVCELFGLDTDKKGKDRVSKHLEKLCIAGVLKKSEERGTYIKSEGAEQAHAATFSSEKEPESVNDGFLVVPKNLLDSLKYYKGSEPVEKYISELDNPKEVAIYKFKELKEIKLKFSIRE